MTSVKNLGIEHFQTARRFDFGSTFALWCSFVVPSILAITRDSMPRRCLASLLYVGSRAWQ